MDTKTFANRLSVRWLSTSLTLTLALTAALTLSVRADTYTWADPTVSGTWDSSAGLWLLDGSPVACLPQSGTYTVDVVIGNSTDAMTFTYGYGGTSAGTVDTRNSLTVNAGVTFNLAASSPRITFNTVTNRGLMQTTGNAARTFSVRTDGQGTLQFTNSGTIRVSSPGSSLTIAGIVTNTGGLIETAAGTTLAVTTNNLTLATGHGIYGGTLAMAASSTFSVGTAIQGNLMFANLDYTNAGLLLASNGNGINSSSRQLTYTATNGALTNSGTISVWQSPNHDFTGVNDIHSVYFYQSGNNVLTNRGLISVLNESVTGTYGNSALSYRELGAAFVVNNSGAAGGEFTNRGLINIRNTAHGVTTGTTYATFTVSAGANFTNSGTISVSLGAGVTDDAQHYATLLLNTDWTNHGVIFIDGANQSLATASLDLGANNYTQTGAAAELRLSDGGKVIAKNVTVSGGIITGNAIINSGATWEIGTLGADVLNLSGDLTLSGATLSLTGAISAGDWLLASYSGNLLGATLNLSGLSTDFEYLLNTSVANQLYLTITAIPEPAAWALLLSGAALLLTLRRRA